MTDPLERLRGKVEAMQKWIDEHSLHSKDGVPIMIMPQELDYRCCEILKIISEARAERAGEGPKQPICESCAWNGTKCNCDLKRDENGVIVYCAGYTPKDHVIPAGQPRQPLQFQTLEPTARSLLLQALDIDVENLTCFYCAEKVSYKTCGIMPAIKPKEKARIICSSPLCVVRYIDDWETAPHPSRPKEGGGRG